MADTCRICGKPARERTVLVIGDMHEVHCSEQCLRANLRERRKQTWAARRKLAFPALVLLILPGVAFAWHFARGPVMRTIVSGPGELPPEAAVGPVRYGPPWPPTEADWKTEFEHSAWVYPLPGPSRRATVRCAETPGKPAECKKGACGVDLGGEIWGEHVFAAHDGVVDRVVKSGNDGHGGLYVRLSHWSGMVYTQYFHLAAIARGVYPGAHIKAGEIIGLVGDTGANRMHLHFTLSVRPSFEYPEVYFDPEPLMANWPLRLSPMGSVVGLVATSSPPPHSLASAAPRRHPAKPRKTEATPPPPAPEKEETESAPASD